MYKETRAHVTNESVLRSRGRHTVFIVHVLSNIRIYNARPMVSVCAVRARRRV